MYMILYNSKFNFKFKNLKVVLVIIGLHINEWRHSFTQHKIEASYVALSWFVVITQTIFII